MPADQAGTQAGFLARLRIRQAGLVQDESVSVDGGVALYTLCDPRDLRAPRYVGQTASPRRRYRQHVRWAELWTVGAPRDEDRWWDCPGPRRELHQWIRDLYADGERLPCMLVHEWVADPRTARRREQQRIGDLLASGCRLFNQEALRLDVPIPQMQLRFRDG